MLVKLKRFEPSEFALYHPGGALGMRLLLTCEDLVKKSGLNPMVKPDIGFKELLIEMTREPAGGISVVDDDGKIIGIVTDGDIRRTIQKRDDFISLKAKDIMTREPKVVLYSASIMEALDIMENRDRKVLVIPVVDSDGLPIGILRLHDIVQLG